MEKVNRQGAKDAKDRHQNLVGFYREKSLEILASLGVLGALAVKSSRAVLLIACCLPLIREMMRMCAHLRIEKSGF